MDLKDTGWDGSECIYQAEIRNKRLCLVKVVMGTQFLQNANNFLVCGEAFAAQARL